MTHDRAQPAQTSSIIEDFSYRPVTPAGTSVADALGLWAEQLTGRFWGNRGTANCR